MRVVFDGLSVVGHSSLSMDQGVARVRRVRVFHLGLEVDGCVFGFIQARCWLLHFSCAVWVQLYCHVLCLCVWVPTAGPRPACAALVRLRGSGGRVGLRVGP